MSQTNDNKRKQIYRKKTFLYYKRQPKNLTLLVKKKNIINTIGISNKKKVKKMHMKSNKTGYKNCQNSTILS